MLNNIKQWWQDASHRTRIGFSVGAGLIVLLMVVAMLWAFRSDYQVLFTDLNAQDAAAMVKELDKLKTPYELSNGGTSILVPSDVVYKTRLKLMGQNVPLQGGVGFEIFNNSDFGMTEFAQKVNYQRALQGELARTIMAFDEVKYARVHIVMPESGLFKKNKVKPKASVTLIMKQDATLRPEQIVGIQRLVAASVPEIEPGAVTILDHQGVALSRNGRTGEADANGIALQLDMAESLSQRLEIKKQVEAHMANKLGEVLDKALGTNQAIVSVDISLNYDYIKVTKEDVLGSSNDGSEVTGVIVRKRDSVRGQYPPAGDPGTHRSEGKREVVPTESSTTEVEYQTGRRIEQVVSTPGSIRRISVGILVPNYQTEEKLNKLKEVIQMTAGLDIARGDAIAVHSLDQFMVKSPDTQANPATSAPNAATGGDSLSTPPPAKQYIQYLVVLIVLIALATAAWLAYRKRRYVPISAMGSVEREQVLREIRGWLSENAKPEAKGVAP